jgi:hypothetical protein
MSIDVTNGFNNANLPEIRKAIQDALAGLDLGVEFQLGSFTYAQDRFTVRLEGFLPGRKKTEDKAKLALNKRACEMHRVDMTKTPFLNRIGQCRLVGYNPRASSYPWIVLYPNGREYKYSTDLVKLHWAVDMQAATNAS